MTEKDVVSKLETFLALYSTNKTQGNDITSIFDELSIRDETEQKILARAASDIDTITTRYQANTWNSMAAISGTCILFSVGFLSAMAGLMTYGVAAGALLGYYVYKGINRWGEKHEKEQAEKLIQLIKRQACEELVFHYGIQEEYQKAEEKIKKAEYDIYMDATPGYLNADDLDEQGVPRDKKYIN